MIRLSSGLVLLFLLECLGLIYPPTSVAAESKESFAIELLTWDFDHKNIMLNSPWDFYWHELLSPGQTPEGRAFRMSGDLTWHQKINPQTAEPFGSFGYATYKMRLKGLTVRPGGYQILIRSAATAYKAFVYPELSPEIALQMSNGKVAKNRDLGIPQPRPLSLRFYPRATDETWVILIQVSNYHHNRAGLWHPPVLGPEVGREFDNEHDGFIFSIGCILIIGIYNFMIFLRRVQERSTLVFSLFCLVAALRACATGDLLSHYLPEPTLFLYQFKYALEYLSVLWAPLLFCLFTHYNFAKPRLPKRLQLGLALALILSLVILSTPVESYSRWIVVFQMTALSFIVITFYQLIACVRNHKEGAKISLMGSCILCLAVVHDILVQNGLTIPPYISQYGVAAFVFIQSQVVAKRFATAFATAQYLKTKLQYEVELQTANLRSLMENVPIGIFMVKEGLIIDDNYSKHMNKLIGTTDIANQDVVKLLFNHSNLNPEQISMIRSSLVSLLGDSGNFWDSNADHLPHEYHRKEGQEPTQIMEIDWHPILDTQLNIDRILVTLRDVTRVRYLQVEAMSKEQDLLKLVELLGAEPRGLTRFWKDVDAAKIKVNSSNMDGFARELHTLKGIARSLGLKKLTSEIHDLEDGARDARSYQQTRGRFVELMQNYQTLYEKRLHSQSLSERELRIPLAKLDELAKASESARLKMEAESAILLQKRVEALLCGPYYRSLHALCLELKAAIKDLGHTEGSVDPRFEATAPLVYLRELTERNLRGAMLHLIRNSIYHGFRPDPRLPPIPHPVIQLHAYLDQDHNALVMIIQDNGHGLDLTKIEARARALRLSSEPENSPAAIASLIFKPSLSTAESLSETSGRGVGMDAVLQAFIELGGTLSIDIIGQPLHGRQRFRVKGVLPESAFLCDPESEHSRARS